MSTVIKPGEDISSQVLRQLSALFTKFFETHNIFSQSETEIHEYIHKLSAEFPLVLLQTDSEVLGAAFIIQTGSNSEGTHTRSKFRHLAFTNEQIASQILTACESYIATQSQTQKIELTIAQTEKHIDIYEQNGYKKEAELTNHYRWGETCFIFGKSLTQN